MANVDAANGDTEYTLTAALELKVGNHADGAGVWIANLDPTAVVTVEWSGSHAGIGRINLAGQGDSLWVPAGDVTSVTINANVYPAIVGWAYTDPGMRVTSALAPAQSGVTELQDVSAGAAAAITASLGAATPGHTNYLAGFAVTGGGATAASIIAVTVTNLLGKPQTYYLGIPAGATVPIVPLVVTFPRALSGTVGGPAIMVNVPSFGAGNTAACVAAWGYRA